MHTTVLVVAYKFTSIIVLILVTVDAKETPAFKAGVYASFHKGGYYCFLNSFSIASFAGFT
jgi:hypothetical protein